MLVQNNLFNYTSNVSLKPSFKDDKAVTAPVKAEEIAPAKISQENLIALYMSNLDSKKSVKTPEVKNNTQVNNLEYKHNLKSLFEENKAVIYAMVPRTFNAKDINSNELIENGEERGSFLNAIDRLDELKSYGINTLHVLPCYKPGKKEAMGTAGSLYSVADFMSFDPALDDKKNPMNVDEEFKTFVNACHKRGINVMMDIPGCASLDLYEERPDLMAKDEKGVPKVPQGWLDIRMFEPWENKDKRILNKALVEYHEQFISKMLDLGVDGFRVDVARAKPVEFWNEVIPFARAKNPQCAFLAESYIYEDASPMANIPADRPADLLKAGFDSYYGQDHIFHEWGNAKQFHDNMILNLEMTQNLPGKKSVIGSFATHDDKSPMANGGVGYCNLTTALQETLPMTNPYFVSGFESGDRYIYSYAFKHADKSETSCHQYTIHPEWIDIFNYSRRPGGNHPEIGKFMKEMADVRKNYEDIITKGSYIPLQTTNKNDKIIAYARHFNGKTLVIIANKDVNALQDGVVNIPTLSAGQTLKNVAPIYGDVAKVGVQQNGIAVQLPPAKFMMFEVDTPDIEKNSKDVYQQKNIA